MFVVLLKSRRYITVRGNWIQTPAPKYGEIGKVFYSPDENAEADFSLEVKYLFNQNDAHVYEGYIMKSVGKIFTFTIFFVLFI